MWPQSVEYRGKVFRFASRDQTTHSARFVSLPTNEFIEVSKARVEGVAEFVVVSLLGTHEVVRLNAHAVVGIKGLTRGEILLIGPLETSPNGWLVSHRAWQEAPTTPVTAGLTGPPPPMPTASPKPARRSGTVVLIDSVRQFMRIAEDDSLSRWFAHKSHIRTGQTVNLGTRVSFLIGENHRGECAADVAPIA